MLLAEPSLRLNANELDYTFLALYFVFVLGIGWAARSRVSNSLDFLLSGRSLPAWVTGLAFISANLGAVEILGQVANGAQYGMVTTHYYWIGAIPAMIFLGLIMMPFYYRAKVRSVPEYLRLRFNSATHIFNAVSFAVASVLIAGINLYAMALIVNTLIGWPIWVSVLFSAGVVLLYTVLGGLSAAIYNEVLQFFVILAFLIPLTVVGLARVGGWSGLTDAVSAGPIGEQALHAWQGTGLSNTTNPFGNWISITLGLGFVLSFGYWTTNFAEVQRALSAKSMSAARRTPIIGAFPKMVLPFVIIVPGLIAAVIAPNLGKPGGPTYNDTLPLLIGELLPNGLLGIALAGMMAAFMAGMAANVSAFNTVFTYDLWQPYLRKNRPDGYYLKIGRRATVGGVVIAIGTAFLAAGYNNISDYIQVLNSFFNAPLFTTFIIGMLWKRMTPWAGLWSLVAGVIGASTVYTINHTGLVAFSSEQAAGFYGGAAAFVADAIVAVAVTWCTTAKPVSALRGLVWSATPKEDRRHETTGDDSGWYRSPVTMSCIVLAAALAMSLWLK